MNNLIINFNIKNITYNKKYIPKFYQLYRWINVTLNNFFFNNKININITLVNYKYINKLNYKFANNNSITDVLSFPYNYFIFNKHIILGDIFICHYIVIKHAFKKKIFFIKYYARIIIHSLLHLLNFDHNNKFNANLMFKLELKILYQLGY